jgi:hypothetical protein
METQDKISRLKKPKNEEVKQNESMIRIIIEIIIIFVFISFFIIYIIVVLPFSNQVIVNFSNHTYALKCMAFKTGYYNYSDGVGYNYYNNTLCSLPLQITNNEGYGLANLFYCNVINNTISCVSTGGKPSYNWSGTIIKVIK